MLRALALLSSLSLASLYSLAVAPAHAHDTKPQAWCPAGNQVVVVGTFSFTPQQLTEYYQRHRPTATSVLGSECDSLKTCGIIDEWYWANQMAHEGALDSLSGAALRSAPLSTSPMPIVLSPKSFNLTDDVDPKNGILDHHDRYRFSQGLAGQYIACRPITETTSQDAVRIR